MSFRNIDDILKHYGWEGEVKYSEVKKDESDGSQGVSGVGKDRKTTRNANKDVAEGVPTEHGDSL
ncbi:hypothetical protein NLX78_22710 [Paenibacillus sp. Lou8.1]|uniref:hypothetical protein n=1 Tax=Paenibacillus sp. Lou8.1 TaxID=2962041 RepID=UPI0020B8598C|nr:hypothetical protein [Paenibacillus sp. Lou8.1]MCP3810035.1 hypothetical protein [Paenibacillus sp. Lou8.1]